MIRFAIDKWDKNKNKLEAHVKENLKDYEDCEYKKLVEDVVQHVFSDEPNTYNDFSEFDVKKITEIDNGDYQGTLLYLIPQDAYQPDETEYLMTHVSYGSCSGCDTLQAVQYDISDVCGDNEWSGCTKEELEKKEKQAIGDLMTLFLHLVQNTIRPYNNGWREDEKFNVINNNVEIDSEDDQPKYDF